MFQYIFAILLLTFAPPSVRMNWLSPLKNAFTVGVEVQDEFIERCAGSGLTVRYRYLVRMCRSRSWWFDECNEELMFIKSLRYDPITELYYLKADRIGDGEEGTTATAQTKQEAFSYVQRLEGIELSQLVASEEQLSSLRSRYVTISVSAGCKSEYSETFAKVSSILSLGMAPSGVVESGVITFPLE